MVLFAMALHPFRQRASALAQRNSSGLDLESHTLDGALEFLYQSFFSNGSGNAAAL